jgi:ABC-type spermidine/putrescine transport system permease subunit II
MIERRYRSYRWMQHTIGVGLMLWYMAVVLFLFAPIVAAVAYSYNLGILNKQTAALTGWTWQWYSAAWDDVSLRRSVETSLTAAFWSAMISTILGTLLGYEIVRHPKAHVRRFLAAMTYFLLIVPESVIGISLLPFFAVTRVSLGLATLIVGITPTAIAVVALVVRARVLTLDRHVEEAAADLGSTHMQRFWYIILPLLVPAVAAGGVMAYTFSFDNLVVSSFLTTPQVNTLPVYLYGSLQYGPSPAVYAAASIVFVFTVLMLGLTAMLYRIARSAPFRNSPNRG